MLTGVRAPIDWALATLAFKALADETRLRILQHLAAGELCACDLLGHFTLSQPTISHHLAVLTDARLVVGRRQGKWVHYSVNRALTEHLANLLGQVLEPPVDSNAPEPCCSPSKILAKAAPR